MYSRFLQTLAFWCTERYKAVLLTGLVFTILLGALAVTLEVNLSFLSILPDRDPESAFFKEATDKFGGSSDLLLAISAQSQEQAIQFAESLSPQLRQIAEIRSVDYKVDLDFVEKYGLFFLDEKELARVEKILWENRALLQETYKDLHFVPYMEKVDLLFKTLAPQLMGQKEPPSEKEMVQWIQALEVGISLLTEFAREGKKATEKDLQKILTQSLGKDLDESMKNYWKGGYFFSPDGSIMVMSIRMKQDMVRVPIGLLIYETIQRITQEEARKYPGLKAGYTGMMAMGYDDQSSVIERFQILSGISMILVVFLFFYISRLKEGPLLVSLPLVMALAWTFGLVKIGIGYVSLTSMMFGILLYGMGIDFAIHLMVRFNEEYRARENTIEALQHAITGSGRGIITGGMTTAAAFFAMCVSNYKPANHLGYTTGWGLIFSLVAMMTVFPALLCWAFQRKKKDQAKSIVMMKEENRVVTMWVKVVVRYPRAVLLICGAAMVFFGWQMKHFKINYDLEKIITRNMPSIEIKKKINEKFGHTNEFLMVLSSNLEEDRKFAKELEEKKSPATGKKIFAQISSISKYLPLERVQKEILKRMEKIYEVLMDIKIHKKAEGEALSAEEGKKIFLFLSSAQMNLKQIKPFLLAHPPVLQELDSMDKKIHHLKSLLQNPSPEILANLGYGQRLWALKTEEILGKLKTLCNPFISPGKLKRLTLETLPAQMKDSFISKTDSSFLLLAYPRNSSLDPENIAQIRKTLEEVAPQKYTGMMVMADKFVKGGIQEFPLILGSVIAMIVLILLLDFQNIKYTILSLLPILFSSVITMGIICSLDATISVLMLIAFPLILGIGIDDGVHVLHRYKDSGDILISVSKTGRAILLTTVTTVVSFAALLFTNHNGLIGMGLLISLGVSICFIASITLLPALLVCGGEKQKIFQEK